jgi:hypothetical protein
MQLLRLIPLKALERELGRRGLSVIPTATATQARGLAALISDGTLVEVPSSVLTELLGSISQTVRNYVELVEKYGEEMKANSALRGELDAERAHMAWLRHELDVDGQLNELLTGDDHE